MMEASQWRWSHSSRGEIETISKKLVELVYPYQSAPLVYIVAPTLTFCKIFSPSVPTGDSNNGALKPVRGTQQVDRSVCAFVNGARYDLY